MIKVLLLSANPLDAPLSIEEEFRAIDAKIRSSDHRDLVQLIPHGAVRLNDIPGLLMRHTPHVVHFSGHGVAGAIEVMWADGSIHLVPPDALANIFRALKDNVRVVLLNACESAPQAEAIVSQIDCAVGMSDKIADAAAIAFAAAFYEALGYGRSVQTAFDLALVQLTCMGADQALAKLHKRRGVKPSEIILVNPTMPIVASNAIVSTRVDGVGVVSDQLAGLRELQGRFVAAQDRFPRELSFALAMIPPDEWHAWRDVNRWFHDMPKGLPQPNGWKCLEFAGGGDRPETVSIPATENDEGVTNCPLLSSVEPWRCWLMRRSTISPFPTDALSMFHSLATDACRKLDLRDCGMIVEKHQIKGDRAKYQYLLRWTIEKLGPDECSKQTWFDPPNDYFRTTWGQKDTPKRWLVEMPCVFAAVGLALERHMKGLGNPWPPG